MSASNEPVRFYTPDFYPLNNFSAHAIEFEGALYPTAEHAYQAAKFADSNIRKKIRAAKSPLKAKDITHLEHEDDIDPEWSAKKVTVMEKIKRAKLEQHDEVRNVLLQSGTRRLEEDSPVDYFWGTGKDGTEQNVLGELWMKLRDELTES